MSPGNEDSISVGEVLPIRPDETGDQYFERFERNWEFDPESELGVRKRTQSRTSPYMCGARGKQQTLTRKHHYRCRCSNPLCKKSDDDHTTIHGSRVRLHQRRIICDPTIGIVARGRSSQNRHPTSISRTAQQEIGASDQCRLQQQKLKNTIHQRAFASRLLRKGSNEQEWMELPQEERSRTPMLSPDFDMP